MANKFRSSVSKVFYTLFISVVLLLIYQMFTIEIKQTETINHVDGVFNEVNDSTNATSIMIYSAWYDARVPNDVRIIALASANNLPNASSLFCHYLPDGSARFIKNGHQEIASPDFVVKPVLTVLTYPFESSNGSVQIACEPVEGIQTANWSVTVTFEQQLSPVTTLTLLPITKLQILPNRQRFCVCVQPLSKSYDDVHRLVEMIELNRLLGADYFYFYNHSITAQVSLALQYYNRTDYVEVYQWQFESSIVVETAGQMAALADCQRRAMQRCEYLVNVDMDEFIVPHMEKTWHGMHKNYMSRNGSAGSFMFNNVYFLPSKNRSSETDSEIDRYKLRSLQMSSRYLHPLASGERSKVIALAECIEDHYLHLISTYLPIDRCENLVTIEVDRAVGVLHHYRWTTAQLPSDTEQVEDNYVLNMFGDDLLAAAKRVHLELEIWNGTQAPYIHENE